MIRTLAEKMKFVEAGKLVPVDTARCAVCLRWVRLRVDGTIGRHVNTPISGRACLGSGNLPTALDDPSS